MSDSIPATGSPEFSLAVRGYDRLQVETYVDRLRDQLDECMLRLRRTEERAAAIARERNARIADLEDQVAELEQRRLDATAGTFSGLGQRIAQMLELAAAEGTAIRERAGRDADEILERARRQAAELQQRTTTENMNLQRQLHQLRDTLAGVLGAAGAPEADSPAASVQRLAAVDEATQVMDSLVSGTTTSRRLG